MKKKRIIFGVLISSAILIGTYSASFFCVYGNNFKRNFQYSLLEGLDWNNEINSTNFIHVFVNKEEAFNIYIATANTNNGENVDKANGYVEDHSKSKDDNRMYFVYKMGKIVFNYSSSNYEVEYGRMSNFLNKIYKLNLDFKKANFNIKLSNYWLDINSNQAYSTFTFTKDYKASLKFQYLNKHIELTNLVFSYTYETSSSNSSDAYWISYNLTAKCGDDDYKIEGSHFRRKAGYLPWDNTDEIDNIHG